MIRRVREEYVDDEIVDRPRRVVVERRVTGGGWNMDPASTIVAIVLVLVMVLLILALVA